MSSIDPVSVGAKVAMMGVSMALTASQRFEGPRLKNLEVSTGAYGTPYPEVDGHCRLDGCIYAWAEKLREKKVESKTKGGKYTQYRYFLTAFVVAAGHEVDAIVKIRMNNHLVYDTTKKGPISAMFGFLVGLNGSPVKLVKGKNLRIYLGTEDQPVDPRYAAWCEDRYGPDSATARRGTAGIMLEEIPLEKLGNAPPQVGMDVVNDPDAAFLYDSLTLGAAVGPIFSQDRTRALWYNFVGNAYEIYDVPTRTKIIDGTLPTNGEYLAFAPNGYIWGTGDTLGSKLRQFSADGHTLINEVEVGTSSDFVYAIGGWVYLRPYSGTGNVIIQCTSLECVLTEVDFSPAMYFEDLDGFAWTVGIVGTTVTLRKIANGNELTFATGGPIGYVSAATNDDGDFFVIVETTAFVIDRDDGSILASDDIGGSDADHFDFMQQVVKGAPSYFTLTQEIDTSTVDTVRTYDLTDWVAGDASQTWYEPITHSLWGPGGTIRYLDRVSDGGTTLGTIVQAKCERRNIPLTAIDVTDLTQPVIGYWTIQGSGAEQIAPLLDIHDVDARRSDFVLDFKVRGSAASEVIDEGDFVSEGGQRFDLSLVPDDRIPARVEFNYADHTADQQPNTASDTMALDAIASNHKKVFDLSTYVDEPDSAQPKVERFLRRQWFEREVGEAKLSVKWMKLEPGDVKSIQIGEDQRVVRFTEVNRSGLTLQVKWVRDDPRVHDESASAGPTLDGYDPEEIYIVSPSKGQLFDIPFLNDNEAEDRPLLHYAASYYGTGNYPGTIIWTVDADEFEQWNLVDSSDRATWGYSEDELGDVSSPWLWDRGNEITVQLKSGTLTSVTEAEINADPSLNQAVIGNQGRWETINFTTATALGSNRYTLSGFKRGRRGTEWAIPLHAAGDEFWLAEDLKAATYGLSEVGTTETFKPQTVGRDPAGAAEVEVELDGSSLKPYAPANLSAERDPTTGNWTITGVRRTRLGGAWTGGSAIPLSENSEDYEIVILDSQGDEVRELTVTIVGDGNFSATYSASNQATDFGAIQSSIEIRAYQISDAVGRGFPASLLATADGEVLPGSITAGAVSSTVNANITPVNPSHQSGDTLLCIVFARSSGMTASCATAGWTAADGITNPTTFNDSRLWLFQNECDSDSEANPAITVSGGAANQTVIAVVLRIPLRNTAANFVLGTVSANASNSSTIAFAQNSPSIDDGNAIIAIGAKNNAYIVGGQPGVITGVTAGLDWTELVDFKTNTGYDTTLTVDFAVNDSGSAYTAGTAGVKTMTLSVGATSGAVYLEVPLL